MPCEPSTSFGARQPRRGARLDVDDALACPTVGRTARCRLGEPRLECEYRELRPAVAIVMYGTNDLGRSSDPVALPARLRELVRVSVDRGVIRSSRPSRRASTGRSIDRRVAAYNAAIARVAREEQVPLLNYWRSLQGPRVIRFGLSGTACTLRRFDRIRPLDFGRRGLRYGVNLRNLTALQALHKVRRVVLGMASPTRHDRGNASISRAATWSSPRAPARRPRGNATSSTPASAHASGKLAARTAGWGRRPPGGTAGPTR